MSDVDTICPTCEEDITLAARDIKLAFRHPYKGQVLIGCPECARVMVLPLPDEIMTDIELAAYTTNIDDVACVPLLDGDAVRLPAGYTEQLGKKMYRPGGGGPALMKRDYMARYGIDPEIALSKNKNRGAGSFKIGGD